jgi:hypothetical protein
MIKRKGKFVLSIAVQILHAAEVDFQGGFGTINTSKTFLLTDSRQSVEAKSAH